MIAVTRKAGIFAAMTALLLAGCGGGGGGGTTPPTNPPTDPPPTGGITRTGVAIAAGPITEFGSVWVNGVEYETNSAEFIREGQSSSEVEFELGETVLVKGTINDDNTGAVATTVEFEDAVEGPVSSVDELARTFVVFGQTVRIVPRTVIDNDCTGGLAGLTSYPQVEVSGVPDDTGVIEASRVECKTAAQIGPNDLWELNGVVSNLNPGGAMTFEINGFVVDYSTAAVDNFPGGAISAGDPVEAKGNSLNGSGQLEATRVEYKGARLAGDEGDHIEIEGFITSITAPDRFVVNGVTVLVTDRTTFLGGDFSTLNVNLKVEVEGEYDIDGLLNATKVEVKDSTNVRVTALLDSISGSTLAVLGITINTNDVKTRFDDGSAANADPLFPDLARGDYLEVRGQELPSGEITAMEVKRNDVRDRTELRGFVQTGGMDGTNRTLRVLRVLIRTSASTVYRDSRGATEVSMTADEFWAAVGEGSLVDAREDNQPPTLDLAEMDATELTLEAE